MKTSIHQEDNLQDLHKPEELVDVISIICQFVLEKGKSYHKTRNLEKECMHNWLVHFLTFCPFS